MAASTEVNSEELQTWPKFVLFGDSITQLAFSDGGWGAALQHVLQRKCDVVCRGLSGYTTAWGKLVLPQIINKNNAEDIVLVTIFFGANDASLKEMSPKHVPLDVYKTNLTDMLEYLQQLGLGSDQVILITPPALDEQAWLKHCQEMGSSINRLNEVTGQYAKACWDVATERKMTCVDLWTAMQKEKDWQRYLDDGLHLSKEGSQFLAQYLVPLAQEGTNHLPIIFPLSEDVDPYKPEEALLNRNPTKDDLL
ncbi:isoamyl acetate-hydrolyzing esterase 1 homolog [Branchiostoma lanceolatum]|uniref:isoamyl acetate-hydrolyzing esterase 1 homolog n=1 Tax=Branchiostoma lanceolatum TaxID=7740 RepID=UPI003455CAA9